jgi:hypothetical protein
MGPRQPTGSTQTMEITKCRKYTKPRRKPNADELRRTKLNVDVTYSKQLVELFLRDERVGLSLGNQSNRHYCVRTV